MTLTSLPYVLFLIACVFLYWLLPARLRTRLLLAASVGFYLFAMPGQLPVMLLYLWVIYALGRLIARGKNGKPLMIGGILLSVLYLFFYKYLSFTLSLFGAGSGFSLIVPMGISYVTFQCVSYLVKVYKKEMSVPARPEKFFLYALFFAKITAGPIEKPDRFFAEISAKRVLTWKNTLSCCVLILVGFLKKRAAADLVAPAVNKVFAAGGQADALSTAVSIALYSAQIYFDFSGYTDIALGSAGLFGIRLTENFDRPYAAQSVVEFWRGWHISLTTWLREYVYFPLGGSRVSTVKRYRNIMIVFLVSGLWHGANLTFLVWGGLHGLFQVLEIALQKRYPPKENKSAAAEIFAHARTLILVALGWVFFRADSLQDAFRVLGGLFRFDTGLSGTFAYLGLSAGAWILFLLTALFSGGVKRYALGKKLTSRGGTVTCAVLLLMVLLAGVMGAGSGAENSFIYFNF